MSSSFPSFPLFFSVGCETGSSKVAELVYTTCKGGVQLSFLDSPAIASRVEAIASRMEYSSAS